MDSDLLCVFDILAFQFSEKVLKLCSNLARKSTQQWLIEIFAACS